MKRSVSDLTAKLKSAIAEDQGAMEEAFQRGIDSTQPLSLVRLAELCALGERMSETKARRDVAEGDLERGLDLAALARPVRFGAPRRWAAVGAGLDYDLSEPKPTAHA